MSFWSHPLFSAETTTSWDLCLSPPCFSLQHHHKCVFLNNTLFSLAEFYPYSFASYFFIQWWVSLQLVHLLSTAHSILLYEYCSLFSHSPISSHLDYFTYFLIYTTLLWTVSYMIPGTDIWEFLGDMTRSRAAGSQALDICALTR